MPTLINDICTWTNKVISYAVLGNHKMKRFFHLHQCLGEATLNKGVIIKLYSDIDCESREICKIIYALFSIAICIHWRRNILKDTEFLKRYMKGTKFIEQKISFQNRLLQIWNTLHPGIMFDKRRRYKRCSNAWHKYQILPNWPWKKALLFPIVPSSTLLNPRSANPFINAYPPTNGFFHHIRINEYCRTHWG